MNPCHVFLRCLGCIFIIILFVFPLSRGATADDQRPSWCGDIGQRPCGKQDCKTKAGWFIIVYPYESCPATCGAGLTPVNGVCSVPPAACDIACKMQKIKQAIGEPSGLRPNTTMYCFDRAFEPFPGKPFDPYNGRKVTRADLNLPAGDTSVHVDIGGEGLYQDAGRQWGSNVAINLNCSFNRTTFGDTGKPIQNLIFGFGQAMPFGPKFADLITINNTPIFPSEIERVIRPGGTIGIAFVSESRSVVNELLRHLCVFPVIQSEGYNLQISIDVPASFDYQHPQNCPLPKGDL